MLAARPVATSMQLGAELGRLLALGADHQADPVRRRPSPTPASKRALVMTVMPRFGEAALDDLADLGVLERHDLGQVLEQRSP